MKIGTRERGTSHIRHIKKNLAVRFAKTLSSCQVLSHYLHYIKTKGIGVFLVAGRQKILTIMPLDAKDLSHSPIREALRVTARAIKSQFSFKNRSASIAALQPDAAAQTA